MTIRGAVGSVRWGYHRAAELRSWTITRDANDPRRYHLGAVVAHADPFLGARSELHFVVALKGGRAWTWPILELAIAGSRARAILGAPEH